MGSPLLVNTFKERWNHDIRTLRNVKESTAFLWIGGGGSRLLVVPLLDGGKPPDPCGAASLAPHVCALCRSPVRGDEPASVPFRGHTDFARSSIWNGLDGALKARCRPWPLILAFARRTVMTGETPEPPAVLRVSHRTRSTPALKTTKPPSRGALLFLEVAGVDPPASDILSSASGPGLVLSAHPCALPLRFLNVSEPPGRTNPFDSRHLLHKKVKPPGRGPHFFLEVAGVEPAS